MFRFVRLVFLVVLVSAIGLAQARKRVAVLNFEYGTVSSSVAAIFGTNMDVGKGIADLLVNKLVEGGAYSVIERKALDKVMAEQNLGASDRVDPTSAAKIGRVLGVDAIIVGSITQFGRDDKSTSVGGGAIGGITRRYGLGGVGKREAKAVVGITARMINTETAEILSVASGKGESGRGGVSLLGAGGASGTAAGGGYDMSSKNFGATILGEAVNQAVNQLASQLDQQAGRLPTRTVTINAMVADATGNTVILNVGSRAGLKVGDRLEVRRKIREVKDPATGRVLRSIEDKIGEVVITEVDEQSAVGTYTGTTPAKVGDAAKSGQ